MAGRHADTGRAYPLAAREVGGRSGSSQVHPDRAQRWLPLRQRIVSMRRVLTSMSIRVRLLVAYIGIILLGFSGLTVLAGGQITTAVRADYGQRLQNEIRLVAQGLVPSADAYNHGQID